MLLVFLFNMLDSPAASSICKLRRKFPDNSRAPLTVHQPSAIAMEKFGQFLPSAADSNALYFGDIRENRGPLTSYFEGHGAERRPPQMNTAELTL
jgi:hypothetical protein